MLFGRRQDVLRGITPRERGGRAAFKCTPERFAELVERDSIIPAPYMARNYWVSLQSWSAMRDAELKSLIRESYDLVKSKLPKKVQLSLERK
jgi:predicted DNA-binding protein (MmcQ/YjbR family)